MMQVRMARSHTFMDSIVPSTPRAATWVQDVFLAAAGSVFIAICAKIRIGGPVPFTMQTWAVLVVAAALGSRRGTLAVIAYLCEGAAGLPVFAGPVAGPAYLLGPTGGFLIGFLPAAIVVGLLAERRWDRRLGPALIAMAAGDAIILMCGVAWLTLSAGRGHALEIGLRPFWMVELLKVLLAAVALPGAWRIAGRAADH
ncbi:MAG TPA: biotin transporter BioY [Phycisphaerae bacterium]|nr:biotin transporter BioY [Phycisphaerae bacterium]